MASRSCPVPHTKEHSPSCVYRTMITIFFKDCNDFSQDFYNDTIDRLQLHMVKCPCGKRGCLIRYGHYPRKVKFMSSLISLIVQRVWCKECHHTHALIPSLLVPYSRIPLKDQQELLDCLLNHRSPDDVMLQKFMGRVDGGIAPSAPHRSGRAAFPHPALYETDRLVYRLSRVDAHVYLRFGQWMTGIQHFQKVSPVVALLL